MEETENRKGSLVYVALKDKQLAIYGDEGIHLKIGDAHWNMSVAKMISAFNKDDYAAGLAECVREIGQALHEHFPYVILFESTDQHP